MRGLLADGEFRIQVGGVDFRTRFEGDRISVHLPSWLDGLRVARQVRRGGKLRPLAARSSRLLSRAGMRLDLNVGRRRLITLGAETRPRWLANYLTKFMTPVRGGGPDIYRRGAEAKRS